MNLAEHALKNLTAEPLDQPYTRPKHRPARPNKCVKEVLEHSKDDVLLWIGSGLPASFIAPKLEISITAFWHHVKGIATDDCIAKLRANGQESNRDRHYRYKIRAKLEKEAAKEAKEKISQH